MIEEGMETPATLNRQVQKMFSDIAPRYDLLNRLLSCGQDQYWRKRAVARLSPQAGERFLDIATGTADVALEITRNIPQEGAGQVVAMDFSEKMLELAQQKINTQNKTDFIRLESGSAEEMHRVLKPGGRCVILEFSMPKNSVFNALYRFYFEVLLPKLGRLISKHPSAYTYLPETVAAFPVRKEFSDLMQQAGFKNVIYKELTFGIVILYTGTKQV